MNRRPQSPKKQRVGGSKRDRTDNYGKFQSPFPNQSLFLVQVPYAVEHQQNVLVAAAPLAVAAAAAPLANAAVLAAVAARTDLVMLQTQSQMIEALCQTRFRHSLG